MHALDPNQAFDHSKVPVVMFHPGQNDGADVTIVPVLPVQGLVNPVKLTIVDQINSLLGKGKSPARVIQKQILRGIRSAMAVSSSMLIPVWA